MQRVMSQNQLLCTANHDGFEDFTLVRIFIREHVYNRDRVKGDYSVFVETSMLLDSRMRQKPFTAKLRIIQF